MVNRSSGWLLLVALAVSGTAFIFLNTWNVLPCYDCMVLRGRPFPYKITEGFARAPRIVWAGLIADIIIFAATTFVIFMLLNFAVRTSSLLKRGGNN